MNLKHCRNPGKTGPLLALYLLREASPFSTTSRRIIISIKLKHTSVLCLIAHLNSFLFPLLHPIVGILFDAVTELSGRRKSVEQMFQRFSLRQKFQRHISRDGKGQLKERVPSISDQWLFLGFILGFFFPLAQKTQVSEMPVDIVAIIITQGNATYILFIFKLLLHTTCPDRLLYLLYSGPFHFIHIPVSPALYKHCQSQIKCLWSSV